MKKFLKKLIRYDKIYETLKDSIFYQTYKKPTLSSKLQ